MKPIIFSTPMVQAILDGKKTQTRRIVKANIVDRFVLDDSGNVLGSYTEGMPEVYPTIDDAPYQEGDILWVRETWATVSSGIIEYKATYIEPYTGSTEIDHIGKKITWRPSIHMPREAARIFLRVTNVRVERVQEITEEDAIAEGISWLDEACYSNNGWTPTLYDPDSGGSPVFRDGFTALWNSINAKRGYGWDTNPWVWVVKFERISKDEAYKKEGLKC